MQNGQTMGKIASDLIKKADTPISPIEIQRATEKEYIDNLIWCVEHAQKKVDCSSIEGHDMCKDRAALTGDFYIVALIKKEKLLENVLRNYFIPTLSCPTPHFDQTVYKYNSKKESIEYLWTVPDQETSMIFVENKHMIVPEERQLLGFVLKYYNGELFKLAKRLNKEVDKPGVLLEGA